MHEYVMYVVLAYILYIYDKLHTMLYVAMSQYQ